jgi:hypothetical protein
VSKFDKLYYTGIGIVTVFVLIVLMIITMYIKHKLNEVPTYTKPIEIEQHTIIRDTVYIEKPKTKKIKIAPVQSTIEHIKIEEIKQIIDTTKTQQL